MQTKKPVTGKTQKLAKNPPKQPAKPLKAAKPPALKSKAVTARKAGYIRKGNPLSGPAPGETSSQLGFESGVLRRKTVKRTGPGPVATLKCAESGRKASQSRQAAGFEVQGGYWRRKAGYCAQGQSPFRARTWRNESQLGFESGVLRRKTVKRTGPGPVATLKAPVRS